MLTDKELAALHARLFSYRESSELASESSLNALLDNVLTSLETEDSSYRPSADDGNPGGLLDLRGRNTSVIIVPDLHARPDFLLRLLECKVRGESILRLLNQKKLTVICVGDGVHTETQGRDYVRWLEAFDSWQRGIVDCPAMREEVFLGLVTMMTVMELKTAFPENFHFLKGNHENVMNIEGMGDHAFRKFAMEGQMVCDFMGEVYGDVTLHLIRCFETRLPIVAVFGDFCVSHAEPRTFFRRADIINYHDESVAEDVILNFTWTGNGDAEEGSVEQLFTELTAKNAESALWFGGHRPVEGKCLFRQNGHYVQIHNPNEMNIVLLAPGKKFDCEKDIISLIKK